ncbi:hypothetical protein F511_45464 [Dorcoceras hygrometricum]|uniref:Uncharacterized protein n=1 Tax=Dorcoceras hygrometricum TaxID=472368 RepID=A0A2Z6ZX39_9LAMI|nr:hypothetical protein F511_45464 [Dorcoceras hygrometricum]
MCGRWLLLWRDVVRWRLPDGALVLRHSLACRWARNCALAVRWPHGVASLIARKGRNSCLHCAPLLDDHGATVAGRSDAAGRCVRRAGCARCVLVARRCTRRRALPPRFRGGGAAAGRPPLRRVSDDVVTAGMNSSRVWFGLSRAAREVFGPKHDVGPGFGRF